MTGKISFDTHGGVEENQPGLTESLPKGYNYALELGCILLNASQALVVVVQSEVCVHASTHQKPADNQGVHQMAPGRRYVLCNVLKTTVSADVRLRGRISEVTVRYSIHWSISEVLRALPAGECVTKLVFASSFFSCGVQPIEIESPITSTTGAPAASKGSGPGAQTKLALQFCPCSGPQA
jgi:hypothetical protein